MAEYSRLAGGQISSTGGQTLVMLPFAPSFIEIYNRNAATAGAGITRASWNYNMGQGAAALSTFGTGDQYIAPFGGTSSAGLTSGTGFTTVKSTDQLLFGPVYQHTASTDFSISKASPGVVTTTTPHGLTTGNVVMFQNLAQTATTGMQQIAGIPFVVTVTSTTTFTIPWNTNQSNYTAFNSATSANLVGSFKKLMYPVTYAPGKTYISNITFGGATTTVTTTSPHNYVVGQQIGFRIPTIWGATQLDEVKNTSSLGIPFYCYVSSVANSTTFTVNVNSSAFTAFNTNVPFAVYPGLTFPQVIAAGDIGYGGWPITTLTANGNFNPSPQVFNGYTASTTVGSNTIGGPTIQGAFFNATFQGFIIGSGIAGALNDVLDWRAYLHDVQY